MGTSGRPRRPDGSCAPLERDRTPWLDCKRSDTAEALSRMEEAVEALFCRNGRRLPQKWLRGM